MTYSVNYTNPSKSPIVIQDAQANNTTSLTLLGKNYDQYGEIIAESFLKLLENFSYNIAPTNPTIGQVWHDVSNKSLKVYDSSGVWKPMSTVYTGTTSPQVTPANANGDIWANTATGEIYVFNSGTWVEVASQTESTGMRATSRVDTVGTTHYTIEAVTDNQTVFVISTENLWTPSSSEILPDNSVMSLSYPLIYKGINFDKNGSYGVHNLSASTINVGRGNVLLENSIYDNTDGAGITLRTEVNPVNGSIFSVRSAGNGSRLWVGQSHTSTGANSFYVGGGEAGTESNTTTYKIKLLNNGDVSAETVSGNWLASNVEAINSGIVNKLMSPASSRIAIDSRFVERISSDDLSRASTAEVTTLSPVNEMSNIKLMTPRRTRESINTYAPAIINTQFNITGNAPTYATRAWGTVVNNILANGGNVASWDAVNNVVNLSTAMPHANYAIALNAPSYGNAFATDITASSFKVILVSSGGNLFDFTSFSFIIVC